jgi:hypothetical protein
MPRRSGIALKIGKVDLVTHDIGNMVGYAFAAEPPGSGASMMTNFASVPRTATDDN